MGRQVKCIKCRKQVLMTKNQLIKHLQHSHKQLTVTPIDEDELYETLFFYYIDEVGHHVTRKSLVQEWGNESLYKRQKRKAKYIDWALKGKRGQQTESQECCFLCNKKEPTMWKYIGNDDKIIYLCKHCHDECKGCSSNFVHILPTPMK